MNYFTASLLALFLLPAAALFSQDFVVKDRVLVKYRGMERVVEIPESLGVNRIGERAFAGTLVDSVWIPPGVDTIEAQAFSNCTFLKTVRLPNTLTTIGYRAFFNCSFLEVINIPRSLRYIESGAFYNCRSLRSLDMPDALKRIGPRAFSGCFGLESLSVSRRTQIGDHAFMGVPCKISYKD
jgi:hypothetical protein